MFLTIFVKKSFLFLVKKIFDGNFFVEITKKVKYDFTRWKWGSNWEKSRNLELVGASPTEWWLITPRGGSCEPPPKSNRVKTVGQFCWKKMDARKTSCNAIDTRPKKYVKSSQQHRTGFWSYPGHFFNALPDKV